MTLALSGYHWCFGWNRHSTVPSLDDSSFHLHRARKEDVIFQVHMLVKVRFELPQILVPKSGVKIAVKVMFYPVFYGVSSRCVSTD